jgi:hypothetical protein
VVARRSPVDAHRADGSLRPFVAIWAIRAGDDLS